MLVSIRSPPIGRCSPEDLDGGAPPGCASERLRAGRWIELPTTEFGPPVQAGNAAGELPRSLGVQPRGHIHDQVAHTADTDDRSRFDPIGPAIEDTNGPDDPPDEPTTGTDYRQVSFVVLAAVAVVVAAFSRRRSAARGVRVRRASRRIRRRLRLARVARVARSVHRARTGPGTVYDLVERRTGSGNRGDGDGPLRGRRARRRTGVVQRPPRRPDGRTRTGDWNGSVRTGAADPGRRRRGRRVSRRPDDRLALAHRDRRRRSPPHRLVYTRHYVFGRRRLVRRFRIPPHRRYRSSTDRGTRRPSTRSTAS